MSKWFRITCILISTSLIAWELHCHMPMLIQWVRGLGGYAVLGFFLLYCVAVLLFLPIELIALASGALFGFYYGFLINLFSAVVSATLAFMLSRHIGIAWISSQQKKHLSRWLERMESFGWKSLAVSRLTPVPCAVVNYGYGLTNIKLMVYTITNILSFAPYKLMITYAGTHL